MAAAQTNAFTADLHQQAHVVVAHMENMKSRSPNKRLNHVRLAHWTPASRRRLAGRYAHNSQLPHTLHTPKDFQT